MAHIAGLIVTADDAFKKHVGRLMRSSPVPVGVVDAIRDGAPPELVVVDIRGDAASGLSSIERLRVTAPAAAIFAVATAADPDLILQSMRAGANEFFIWPPATRRSTAPSAGWRRAARPRRARGRPRRHSCSSAPRAAPARRRWR